MCVYTCIILYNSTRSVYIKCVCLVIWKLLVEKTMLWLKSKAKVKHMNFSLNEQLTRPLSY